jgi:hypothetical protein
VRPLVSLLSEIERLEDGDAFGVVSIEQGAAEADYATDVLDLTRQALADAGEHRTVEIFVVLTDPHSSQDEQRSNACHEQDSTPTRRQQPAKRDRSRSAR